MQTGRSSPERFAEVSVGYRIDIDVGNCINCGICMDVCPVGALDMSRPERPGIEAKANGAPLNWMMEYPVQVGECIGCGTCITECPVVVMTLATQAGATPLKDRQGPIGYEAPPAGWLPLSAVTRESLKRTKASPFEPLYHWQTHRRPGASQVWDTMVQARDHTPHAPCQDACPAGTDAGRYVGLIAQGRYSDAYAVAAEVNPFPSVCGWICTAPCENVCRRGILDEPIAIRTLKRFAAENGTLPAVSAPVNKRPQRVAIVGGGPAGMSAAYYLARLGYGVTVHEAMPVPGGMMAIGIPSYRLPREVLQEEIGRIVSLGVDLRLNAAMGRDFTLDDLERDFDAVFLATGAPKSRRLGVPGDDLRGVIPATVFLKQVNLGEEPRLRGSAVVVGGGSTAMDAARSAWRSGAEHVTVLYRRGRGEMPAQVEEVEAAEREGVVIQTGIIVTEVVEHAGRVGALRIQDQEPTGETEAGRAAWAAVAGTERDLEASVVLVAVGEEPDPSILPHGAGIEVSSFAGIVTDPRTLATGKVGVFAGGDVVSGPKTIIDAVAAGRRAAGAIHEFLANVTDGEREVLAAVRYRTAPEAALRLDLAQRPRAHPPLPMVDGTFAATQVGFDEGMARSEATRCFRCDAVHTCSTVDVLAGRGPAAERMGDRVVQPGGVG
jgi:NADPH-dependent glutamate synthase beta subunit-like oxidoreductase/NAD-dependent dihydropyrimidine dehydrogenase PreA subunit